MEADLAASIRRERWQDIRELAPIVAAVLFTAGIGVFLVRDLADIVVLAMVIGLISGLRR